MRPFNDHTKPADRLKPRQDAKDGTVAALVIMAAIIIGFVLLSI